jgi:hypothetical protein
MTERSAHSQDDMKMTKSFVFSNRILSVPASHVHTLSVLPSLNFKTRAWMSFVSGTVIRTTIPMIRVLGPTYAKAQPTVESRQAYMT